MGYGSRGGRIDWGRVASTLPLRDELRANESQYEPDDEEQHGEGEHEGGAASKLGVVRAPDGSGETENPDARHRHSAMR